MLSIFREAYLVLTMALVAGAYWPWAEISQFALRPFTEGISVWLIVGLAPVALFDAAFALFKKGANASKVLVRQFASTQS